MLDVKGDTVLRARLAKKEYGPVNGKSLTQIHHLILLNVWDFYEEMDKVCKNYTKYYLKVHV